MGIKSTQGKNKFEQIDYKATSDIGETLDPVYSADATGGTIVYHSADNGTSVEKYHIFTEPGYFRINAGFAKTTNVLLVAGGGAGGGAYYAGGGGAGEVLYGSNVSFGSSEGNEYRVIVGRGGLAENAPNTYNSGSNGEDSWIYPTIGITTEYRSEIGIQTSGIRAYGGGGGGAYSGEGYERGNRGGCAGGSSYYDDNIVYARRYTNNLPPSWTPYKGNSAATTSQANGGGGAGGNSSTRTGGPGQAFPQFSSNKIQPAIPQQIYPYWSTAVGPTGQYGGGGGGGGYPGTNPAGGAGGGGAGGSGAKDAEPGIDYTGSGGGGADDVGSNAGSGGKGILIIKYVV
jgi:hypothetical protein